jgi:hypothetical protein
MYPVAIDGYRPATSPTMTGFFGSCPAVVNPVIAQSSCRNPAISGYQSECPVNLQSSEARQPAVHTDFQFIFAANPLKTLSGAHLRTQNRPNPGATISQMKPAPMISTRPTSERRAAAARANGAKSRGPSSCD